MPDTTPSTPTPTPADPTLQQRVAEALFGIVSTASETPTATEQTIFGEMARAVLAELAPELAELADYRSRIAWETTCGEHAALLDACRAADERAEQAEAMVAELTKTLAIANREVEAAATTWDADLDKRTAGLIRRAQQLEELLAVARDTSNRSEAERARAVQRAEQAETILRDLVQLTSVTHKYRIQGGHDSLGENLGCATCALAERARQHLAEAGPATGGA